MSLRTVFFLFIACIWSCDSKELNEIPSSNPYIIVLGIAQDGGYPQTGCDKDCCKKYYDGSAEQKYVTSLAIVDPQTNSKWLIDATPDIKDQIYHLKTQTNSNSGLLDGIFLTHAHIGHYTGLMQLGHEAMGAKNVPVHVMPKMKEYLTHSGPWSQLVDYENIILNDLKADSTIQINEKIRITPFLVPHRDEYSETVGFRITGPSKSVIFIPDINKWEIWDQNIIDFVTVNDVLFLDGTFYQNGEIQGRDMSEFPHPFIEESILKFQQLPEEEKRKVYFIHLNHTNPAIQTNSKERHEIEEAGFNVARQFQIIYL